MRSISCRCSADAAPSRHGVLRGRRGRRRCRVAGLSPAAAAARRRGPRRLAGFSIPKVDVALLVAQLLPAATAIRRRRRPAHAPVAGCHIARRRRQLPAVRRRSLVPAARSSPCASSSAASSAASIDAAAAPTQLLRQSAQTRQRRPAPPRSPPPSPPAAASPSAAASPPVSPVPPPASSAAAASSPSSASATRTAASSRRRGGSRYSSLCSPHQTSTRHSHRLNVGAAPRQRRSKAAPWRPIEPSPCASPLPPAAPSCRRGAPASDGSAATAHSPSCGAPSCGAPAPRACRSAPPPPPPPPWAHPRRVVGRRVAIAVAVAGAGGLRRRPPRAAGALPLHDSLGASDDRIEARRRVPPGRLDELTRDARRKFDEEGERPSGRALSTSITPQRDASSSPSATSTHHTAAVGAAAASPRAKVAGDESAVLDEQHLRPERSNAASPARRRPPAAAPQPRPRRAAKARCPSAPASARVRNIATAPPAPLRHFWRSQAPRRSSGARRVVAAARAQRPPALRRATSLGARHWPLVEHSGRWLWTSADSATLLQERRSCRAAAWSKTHRWRWVLRPVEMRARAARCGGPAHARTRGRVEWNARQAERCETSRAALHVALARPRHSMSCGHLERRGRTSPTRRRSEHVAAPKRRRGICNDAAAARRARVVRRQLARRIETVAVVGDFALRRAKRHAGHPCSLRSSPLGEDVRASVGWPWPWAAPNVTSKAWPNWQMSARLHPAGCAAERAYSPPTRSSPLRRSLTSSTRVPSTLADRGYRRGSDGGAPVLGDAAGFTEAAVADARRPFCAGFGHRQRKLRPRSREFWLAAAGRALEVDALRRGRVRDPGWVRARGECPSSRRRRHGARGAV